MIKAKVFIVIVFQVFLVIQNILCQDLDSLVNLVEFTSHETFFVNDLYEVFSQEFSEDGSINLKIEGDISDRSFSLALVSMLPALKERKIYENNIEFIYNNLNNRNFEEAKIIDAINELYPEKLQSYLLNRSQHFFNNEWQQFALSNYMDINSIISFHENPISKANVLSKFKSKLNKGDYRIFVNDLEFNLIPSYFFGFDDNDGGGEPKEGGFDGICCDPSLCASNCIYEQLYLLKEKQHISYDEFNSGIFSTPGLTHGVIVGCIASTAGAGNAAFSANPSPIGVASVTVSLMNCVREIIKEKFSSLEEEHLEFFPICQLTCNETPCHYEKNPEKHCPDEEICVPIKRLIPTDNLFSLGSEEVLDCKDCPVSKLEDDILDEDFISVFWDEDIISTGYFGGYLNPTLYTTEYDYRELYNYEVSISVNGRGKKLIKELGYDASPNSSFTFDEFLGEFGLKIGDEICMFIDPVFPYMIGDACTSEVCEEILCPEISLLEENGGLFLNVKNFKKFQWPGSFAVKILKPSSTQSNFTLQSITEDGKFRIGDVNETGCYTYKIQYWSNTSDENKNEIDQLFQECFNTNTPSEEECPSTSEVCNGLCISDPCDLKENDIDFNPIIRPNTSLNGANGAISMSPFESFPHPEYEVTLSGNSTPVTFPMVNLVEGDYFITIKNVSTGCSETFKIVVPSSLIELCGDEEDCTFFSWDITNATGPNFANGSINLFIPTFDFIVDWQHIPGLDNPTNASQLLPGEYCVEVLTENQSCCYQRECFTVRADCAEILLPEPTIMHTCTNDDGIIQFSTSNSTTDGITGGDPPYSLKWSNGEEGFSITNLEQGRYSVTVEDAIGCSVVGSYFIENLNNPFEFFLLEEKIDCSSMNYDIRISLSTPNGSTNDVDGLIRVGLTDNPDFVESDVGYKENGVHFYNINANFYNVQPGWNTLFVDLSGAWPIDLTNSCNIIEFDFYLPEFTDLPLNESTFNMK